MGSVQQAVLEFDEAVQAPWRPSLRVVSGGAASQAAPVPSPSGRAAKPGAYRNRVAGSQAADSPARAGRDSSPVAVPEERAAAGPDPRHPRPPGRRPAAPVRLTRRARRLAVVLSLAAAVAVGSAVGPLLPGGAGGLELAGDTAVVVGPGDTLWSIASSVAGDRDVRAVVDEIVQVNGLRATDLVPGQVLRLP